MKNVSKNDIVAWSLRGRKQWTFHLEHAVYFHNPSYWTTVGGQNRRKDRLTSLQIWVQLPLLWLSFLTQQPHRFEWWPESNITNRNDTSQFGHLTLKLFLMSKCYLFKYLQRLTTELIFLTSTSNRVSRSELLIQNSVAKLLQMVICNFKSCTELFHFCI